MKEKCGVSYSRFETLCYLNIYIPNEITIEEYEMMDDVQRRIFKNERTLEACYDKYFEANTSRDGSVRCNSCDKESPAFVLRILHTAPDV